MALSLVSAASAFNGPALAPALSPSAVSMRAQGEIGVTPPLGVYDPLKLTSGKNFYPKRDYRRYVELEIKHGRISMLACLGVITTEAGIRFPGYLSYTENIKFADMPGGALDSYAAVPDLGWLQIVAFVSFLELAYGQQDPKKEPGDVGGISWKRYSNPAVKQFKLNAERNNGRAAMMGITGMMLHNAVGVDSLFPIVGGN